MDEVWFCYNVIKTSIYITYFSCLILQLLEDDRDKKKSRPKASGNLQISSSVSAFVKFFPLSISIQPYNCMYLNIHHRCPDMQKLG